MPTPLCWLSTVTLLLLNWSASCYIIFTSPFFISVLGFEVMARHYLSFVRNCRMNSRRLTLWLNWESTGDYYIRQTTPLFVQNSACSALLLRSVCLLHAKCRSLTQDRHMQLLLEGTCHNANAHQLFVGAGGVLYGCARIMHHGAS